MSDQDDFININLEDVDTGGKPIYENEGVHPVRIVKRTRKQKSEEGSYAYHELQLQPLDIEGGQTKRRLFLNLSTHPEALWNTRLFVEACQLPLHGFRVEMLDNRELLVTVALEPDFRDPSKKRNVVKPPYHPFK